MYEQNLYEWIIHFAYFHMPKGLNRGFYDLISPSLRAGKCLLPKHPPQATTLILSICSAILPVFSPRRSGASSPRSHLRRKHGGLQMRPAGWLEGRQLYAWSLTGRKTASAAWRALAAVPELLSHPRRQLCDISISSTLSTNKAWIASLSFAFYRFHWFVLVIILNTVYLNLIELARNFIPTEFL